MNCPLCGDRKARRACPAVGRQICAVCCGTKRLVEIACPSDCAYLAAAREHPAAIEIRQRQRDLSVMVPLIRDLNTRQAELFSVVATVLRRLDPSALDAPVDADVEQAMQALASTYETAARGIIYEQRPASSAAARLVDAVAPAVAEFGRGLGAAFERDAAVLLRRFADAVRQAHAAEAANRRAFLDLLRRVTRDSQAAAPPQADEAPRLILP